MSSAMSNKKKLAIGNPFASVNLMPTFNPDQMTVSSMTIADHRLSSSLGSFQINSSNSALVFGGPTTQNNLKSLESYLGSPAAKTLVREETSSKSELLPSINSAFQVPNRSHNISALSCVIPTLIGKCSN